MKIHCLSIPILAIYFASDGSLAVYWPPNLVPPAQPLEIQMCSAQEEIGHFEGSEVQLTVDAVTWQQ